MGPFDADWTRRAFSPGDPGLSGARDGEPATERDTSCTFPWCLLYSSVLSVCFSARAGGTSRALFPLMSLTSPAPDRPETNMRARLCVGAMPSPGLVAVGFEWNACMYAQIINIILIVDYFCCRVVLASRASAAGYSPSLFSFRF